MARKIFSFFWLVVAAGLFSPLWADETDDSSFSFMVVADTAYKVPHDYAVYDQLIARINSEKPAFTIHLGDVFSGQTDCGNTQIFRVAADFGKYEHPLIYTPGDNEWTDCHHEAAGAYKPEERLKNIRELFFKNSRSLGQQKMRLNRQVDRNDGLVENLLWQHQDVLFASLHIVGSNNGLLPQSHKTSESEYFKRNKANVAWLKTIFQRAEDIDAKALVLAFHANMFAPPLTPDGFHDVRALIGMLGDEFGKPVLLVHGDHHQFVVDRPYLPKIARKPGAHITRLQTFGWPDAKAIKITIDTARSDMFTYQPVFSGKGFY